jgi:hypothetical protein
MYVIRNCDKLKSYKIYADYNNFQVFVQKELYKAELELKIKHYSSKTIKSYLIYRYSLRE